jgi:hypothetical protein
LWCSGAIKEANSSKWVTVARVEVDAQISEGIDAVRKQTFATRLVDRRAVHVCEGYFKSVFSYGDRGSQTRWTAAYDKHIRHVTYLDSTGVLNSATIVAATRAGSLGRVAGAACYSSTTSFPFIRLCPKPQNLAHLNS